MKDRYKIQITKYALMQMEEIRNYIANELLAPQAAYNLLLEMKKMAASLESMPERNPLVDIKKWRDQGIRKTIVKNFIIYYWTDEERQTVYITLIVYEKRNQLMELGKMELEYHEYSNSSGGIEWHL